ncbi:MAG: hypothetical protein ACI8P0_003238, partial [Planctomycetaceae bacterium]
FLKNDSRRLSPAGETVTLFNYSADISFGRPATAASATTRITNIAVVIAP